MKFGLIIYQDTDNIGDDIQSYAAELLLPKIDYIIDREQLNIFKATEKVAVLLNGWYLHSKFNWPPSPYLYPLFIGYHLTPSDCFQINNKFFDEICINLNYSPSCGEGG